MKLPILDLQKRKTGEKELPFQFLEKFRPDLIKRAVLSLQSQTRQAHGAHPDAGLRHSTYVSKRRREYKGCYGFGISRVARKVLSRRGTRMNWVGAFSPQTVGGRRAHPPKAQTLFTQKINQKEKRKALRSAMSATLNKILVTQRGHHLPPEYPFLLSAAFEQLNKTKEIEKALRGLGFEAELERSAIKKVRAGKGKGRGNRYQRKKGILIVVENKCPALKSAQNLAGIDIIPVKALNAELLAPGSLAGRVTLWTETAIEIIKKENLFA